MILAGRTVISCRKLRLRSMTYHFPVPFGAGTPKSNRPKLLLIVYYEKRSLVVVFASYWVDNMSLLTFLIQRCMYLSHVQKEAIIRKAERRRSFGPENIDISAMSVRNGNGTKRLRKVDGTGTPETTSLFNGANILHHDRRHYPH